MGDTGNVGNPGREGNPGNRGNHYNGQNIYGRNRRPQIARHCPYCPTGLFSFRLVVPPAPFAPPILPFPFPAFDGHQENGEDEDAQQE